MAQWGVWLCGVLWVVPCVVMLYWLSSRAAQIFSFDTTIFSPGNSKALAQNLPRDCTDISMRYSINAPFNFQRNLFEGNSNLLSVPVSLFTLQLLHPSVSWVIWSVLKFLLQAIKTQTLGYFSFHSGGILCVCVSLCPLQLPTPNYCRLNSRDVGRSRELLPLSWLRDLFFSWGIVRNQKQQRQEKNVSERPASALKDSKAVLFLKTYSPWQIFT